MPWTKTNYPSLMKNLQVGIRTKAIEIANAMLKQNKKMNEGILIATSIKSAKKLAVKNARKTTPVKKSKAAHAVKKSPEKKTKTIAVEKKQVSAMKVVKKIAVKSKKALAKKVTKMAAVKKRITPVKKTKTVTIVKKQASVKKAAKKIAVISKKAPAKKVTKIAAVNKRKTPVKKVPKSFVVKKIVSPETDKTKSAIKNETPIIPISIPEIEIHGEDLHLIPRKEDIHPITTLEAHQKENIFHHREVVAFHQENKKVKAAMPSRKNKKITYRMKGRR